MSVLWVLVMGIVQELNNGCFTAVADYAFVVAYDAASVYATHSGFTSGNGLSSFLPAVISGGMIAWVAWAVVADLRSWSAGSSDSITLVSVLIRGAMLVIATGIILSVF